MVLPGGFTGGDFEPKKERTRSVHLRGVVLPSSGLWPRIVLLAVRVPVSSGGRTTITRRDALLWGMLKQLRRL